MLINGSLTRIDELKKLATSRCEERIKRSVRVEEGTLPSMKSKYFP
jgi:hypothetical protein